MRYVLFIFFVSNIYADEAFWFNVNQNKYKQYLNRTIEVTGQLVYFKKYIRARDNYYILKIRDPNSMKELKVKYYTIRRLARINYFSCKEGNSLTLMGKFYKSDNKDFIGMMNIDKTAKKFQCSQQIEGSL